MPYLSRRADSSNFAVIASLAALLGGALVAQGCDDVTARSFGGNVAETGGSGVIPDGALARGHGGTTAVSVASGGAGGMTQAQGGASAPASSGGGGAAAPATSTPNVSTTGTGGVTVIGTGGVPAIAPASSGGASATGGMVGSGGMVPTVVVSTGGVPAAAGTGGKATAGAPGMPAPGAGAGGSAGPAPGAGGASPNQGSADDAQSGSESCAMLVADYDDAVTKAKSCNAKGKAASSCAKAVPAKLSGCGASCSTFVDDDGMVNMVRQKWMKAGCVADSCALEVCVNPMGATCASDGHDDKGTCTDSLLGI